MNIYEDSLKGGQEEILLRTCGDGSWKPPDGPPVVLWMIK
jgi:hypothetical protein